MQHPFKITFEKNKKIICQLLTITSFPIWLFWYKKQIPTKPFLFPQIVAKLTNLSSKMGCSNGCDRWTRKPKWTHCNAGMLNWLTLPNLSAIECDSSQGRQASFTTCWHSVHKFRITPLLKLIITIWHTNTMWYCTPTRRWGGRGCSILVGGCKLTFFKWLPTTMNGN